jgi:hypothetical protein
MRATILLAEAARAAEGKLFVLGGGWNIIGPEPHPMAIAILVEVPWDKTNMKLPWRLELLDADGEPVRIPDADGQPVLIEGEIEVGRPPGVKPGSRLPVPIAVNVSPLPLPSGSQFQWKLHIAGETQEHWDASFFTR